jgi:hypothetical protein
VQKPSKPFVITSVIMLLFGSVLGALWMMTLFGVPLSVGLNDIIRLHRSVQFDGFITMLIMGIGYMIVPRFRNIPLPSPKLAYISYVLMMGTVVIPILTTSSNTSQWLTSSPTGVWIFCKVGAVTIFDGLIFTVLRTRPKLLGMADYFIALSIILLAILTISQILNQEYKSSTIQLWFMFPIVMIFGIEYKTLPAFVGFVRPRNRMATSSVALLAASTGFGLMLLFYSDSQIIETLFYTTFLMGVITFSFALNIFVGFDNKQILELSMGEKKARYRYTLVHVKVSFMFLFLGITLSIISLFFADLFSLYDMWIHITAIGFIGITIALYLPMMLPPIIGRTVRFSRFSKIPLSLVIISLCLRALGHFFIQVFPHTNEIPYLYLAALLGMSGWLVVLAVLSFMFMVHRSMNSGAVIVNEDGTSPL